MSQLYNRFTDRARKVMQLANQEAQRFNHEYIGTEHILLGLIKERSGVAANVLKNLGIELATIRQEVEKLVQPGPDMLMMGKLPQTPRAKKVIDYSMEEARNLNHNYVGTEHLLLALIREEEGVASQILKNLGLSLARLRAETIDLLRHGSPSIANDKIEPPMEAVQIDTEGLRASTNPASIAALQERFTPAAKKLMKLADQEAHQLNSLQVGTEHILLGLSRIRGTVADRVLGNLGVDLHRLRPEVEKLVRPGASIPALGEMSKTPQARKAIQYAMEEAYNFRHNYVGTEHLLLGLLREQIGVAAQVLRALGVTLEAAREGVLKTLDPAREKVVKTQPSLAHEEVMVIENPPAKRSKCGHTPVVRVLDRRRHLSVTDLEEIFTDRAILGPRHCASLPFWICLKCAPAWSEVHRLSLQDYQWQFAKEEAVKSSNFPAAAKCRDAQKELRRQMETLLQNLLRNQ